MQKELGRYSQDQDYLDHSDILRFLRKYLVTLIICSAAGGGLAVAYVLTTSPTYTARAQILIGTAAAQTIGDKTGAPESGLDAAKVEGQIAVLRSETIAQSVIAKLNLQNSPDFAGSAPSLLSRVLGALRSLIAGGQDASPEDIAESEFIRSRVAIAQFQGNLDIRRVGLSYAIDITYTSRDPVAAAQIANTVADVYVQDQIRTMSESARQNSAWLEQRIDELRKQLNDSAREVQLFRSGQNLPPADPRNFIPPQNQSLAGPRPQGPALYPNPSAGQPSGVQAWVTLAELESKAQNYQKVYETYLQAFTETVQKQSLQIANARVITAATRPLSKAQPKSKLIAILGVLLGGLGGLAVAFIRHSMDNTVQSAKQLRDHTGLNCLAMVPLLTNSSAGLFSKGADPLSMEYTFREVAAAPFSPFSGAMKTVRSAIVNASGKTPARVIGITSALPGEGKTTICGNLALLFALAKSRVLLVDVDIHHATISHTFAPDVKAGLIEVLNGEAALNKAIVSGQGRGPDILPLFRAASPAFPYDLLSSDKMRDTLVTLRKTYDYIILDMPPLRPIVDGLAISSLLDGVILVAEWSETPLNLLEDVASGLHTAQAEVLGVILSKVDPSLVSIPWRKQQHYNYQPQ